MDASSNGKKGKSGRICGGERNGETDIRNHTAQHRRGQKTLAISGDSDSSGFLVNNRGTVDASQAEGIQITNHGGAGSHAAGFVCYNQKGAVVSRSSAQERSQSGLPEKRVQPVLRRPMQVR